MSKQVVLITGASSGIGKSIGEYLHQKNYKVYGTSRNPKQKELNGIHFVALDVTSTSTIFFRCSGSTSARRKNRFSYQ